MGDNQIDFEFVIESSEMRDLVYKDFILEYIVNYGIHVRFIKGKISVEEYCNILENIQESLLNMGSDLVLSQFLEGNNEKIEYMTIYPNKYIIDNLNIGVKIDEVYKGISCKDNLNFVWLSSSYCYVKNEYLRLRNAALKRIQERIKGEIINTEKDSEQYDIVFIYANRIKSTISVPFPPIAPYYLNTLVKSYGFSSKVIQCTENNFKAEFEKIKDKTKIIGFYCACNNQIIVTNIVRYIKKVNSNIITIVGGPQASVLNENFFVQTNNDIVTEGEGEGATIDLLNYYIHGKGNLENIGNIKYYENDKLFINPQREIITNLNELPFARIKRKDISKYNETHRIFVLTGRGCPNRCTFCYEGANARKVRYRTMRCVFDEINYLLSEFPLANVIHILDDTFTCMPSRVYEFCEEMIKIRKKRKVDWVCEVHINTLYNKPELLKKMVESGMKGFQIGLESGSDIVLNAYKKNTTAKMIYDFIDMCSKISDEIFIEGNIIIGGPFESKETIERSLEICKYLLYRGRGMVELNSLCFYPLPNTDITNHPEKYGLEILWDEVDSSILAMANVVTCSEYLSKREIEEQKELFERAIQEKYTYETFRMSKKQIMKFWNAAINQFMIGSRWGAVLNRYEHFVNYAISQTFDSPEMIKYSQDIYPVRTFDDLQYLDVISKDADMYFDEIDRNILRYCTGKYTVLQIASKLMLEVNIMEEKIEFLSSQCLLYYSLF